ncbi:helix-turn-helix transcriptional regulator [Pseudoalteromonas denitrificans]|uniref:Transcriptional regulator n=1 Tax=Pseudoalteromonas denitrificans DSM 6059 TaxID=1123010 RepID=A0A1I1ELU3_9GAMM|nr:metalloregulator ArsR/SmtB family transcription factor [Pseudoalteromonas denitrificans]SFB88149.1 transcriptional regulator [Pseudoalteromonas denitrificans DSM 6059]
MKTSDKIISLLKIQGPLTAKYLANELKLTTMGVRQHLQILEDAADITFEDKKALRGRPTRYWSLTTKSNNRFSDRHEELSVQLIDSVKSVFGDSGLEQLISHREESTLALYQAALVDKNGLLEKLEVLAELRSKEGYMASIVIGTLEDDECDENVYWLLENHCPICAAASKCLNFCRSELNLFQTLLKGFAIVSREEHIIEGARRCAYKISPTL